MSARDDLVAAMEAHEIWLHSDNEDEGEWIRATDIDEALKEDE